MARGFAFGGTVSDDSGEPGDAPVDDSSLADLLYDGENVEATVPIDGGALALTSHRLLAYTPNTDGRTLRVVQRPNVEGVTVTASAESAHLPRALKALLVGGLLLGVGVTIPVDGVADAAPTAGGASAPGLGGTIEILATLLAVVALIDDALRLVGAVVLLVGATLLGLYLRSRQRVVVVTVAGGEDVSLDAENAAVDDIARLVPES